MPTEGSLDAVLETARALGFLGPGPIEAQRAHADAFVAAVRSAPTSAVDLGSGGGLPGLVLVAALPASRWLLVDAMAKRTAFLRTSVAVLGLLDRVEVITGRAEDVGRTHRGTADLVVARGFGPPAVTAECAAPFLRVGGQLLVSEPPGGAPDRWDVEGLEALGLVIDEVLAGPPAFVSLRQAVACDERYPRRSGVPRKRPLWT
jgi:16S rRNA (guanine527-N7)-methyltransferase